MNGSSSGFFRELVFLYFFPAHMKQSEKCDATVPIVRNQRINRSGVKRCRGGHGAQKIRHL